MKVLSVLGAAVLLVAALPVALVAVVAGPSEFGGAPSTLALAEIPADLLPVYQAAAQTCSGLPWQVLAAVGEVESAHAGGHADPTTGDVGPPIVGPALDGRAGFAAIPDPSQVDGWAHALGPMQLLSSTWTRWATLAPDRPPGAVASVQNAWDSIFSAAAKLCSGRPALEDVDTAILAYNNSPAYLEAVLAKAIDYGLSSDESSASSAMVRSAQSAVAAAMTVLGKPYVWGGSSPASGFDCSGLVKWAYAQIGIALPRTTFEQLNVGMSVGVEDLRPGDLVFSRGGSPGDVQDFGHVAIYAGGGKEIAAPHAGTAVSISPVVATRVQAVRRIVSAG